MTDRILGESTRVITRLCDLPAFATNNQLKGKI